jgi:Ca2+-transporting ATPase
LIVIESGMRIPADCLLIEGMDVTVDERMYYEGVSKIMKKEVSKDATQHRWNNPDCFLLSKSMVLTGVGKAVVCAVGKNTRIHEMTENEMLKDSEELTPLQEKLGDLAG